MSLIPTPQSLQFIDGSGDDYGTSIATDATGNSYVTGYTNTTAAGTFTFAGTVFQKPATGNNALYVGKIDSTGVAQWLVMLDGPIGGTTERAASIASASNGDVYIAGFTDLTVGGPQFNFITCALTVPAITTAVYDKQVTSGLSIVLLKLNTSGGLVWLRNLAGVGAGDENAFSIGVNRNNTRVCFTGYTSTTASTNLVYTSCLQGGSTTSVFSKPATIAQSIMIGGINATSGVCDWISLVDGVTLLANEQGTGIAFEDIYSLGSVVITGYTASTIGGGSSLTFIQCGTAIAPAALNKLATVGDALFVLRLGHSTGNFHWMSILDSIGTDRGISATIGYNTTSFDPEIYLTGTVTVPSSVTTMTYSPVLFGSTPTGITWNIPTLTSTNQTATMLARINFGNQAGNAGGDLEVLKFFDISSNPEIPTGIATKPWDLITVPDQYIYVSGNSTSGGGSATFGTASTTLPLPPVQTITIPTITQEPGFILKLDQSLNYLDSKWIYSLTDNYSINGITVDNQDNVYVTGITTPPPPGNSPAGPVTFGDVVFQKPATVNIAVFVGKLKNLSSSSSLSAICYAKGTLIGTDRGFVPIEDIRLSDKLRTYDCIKETTFKPVGGIPFKTLTRVEDTRYKNRFANIKFIGHFTVDFMHEKTAPIRITAGALGYSKPERDLLVSPNHSMLIGDRLIFAKNLVNGSTIYQDMSFKKIEYYHILSDDHYLINANGTLSETLGSEELKLFETMIYAQSQLYKPLASENKYHLHDVEMVAN